MNIEFNNTLLGDFVLIRTLPITDQDFAQIIREYRDWRRITKLVVCIGYAFSCADRYSFADFMRLQLSPEQQKYVRDMIQEGIIEVEAKFGLQKTR